jgi:ketosteroid isomerase-like protein
VGIRFCPELCADVRMSESFNGDRWFNRTMSDDVSLVLAYIEASQRARTSQRPEDFDATRGFLADDIEIKVASPWTDAPWRVHFTSAENAVERLKAPINKGLSLTTKNTNVSQAGRDVLVEQLSTIVQDGRTHISMVCHIFTIEDGKVSAIRTYRNESGIPPG